MANEVQATGGAGAAKGTERLGTERIGKLLLEFSIPAIVSMVFNSLYNVVDTAFLGHAVGSAGVAVTTLVLPVMTILMGFSMLAGQGGNALAAIQLGEGRKDQVEKTLGNAAALLVLFAAASAVVGTVLIDPLLALIAAPADLWDQTKSFVQVICVGFVFLSLGMGLNNFLRTAGKPNLALGTMVFGTIMCVVLNYLFVIVCGWGIPGSAYATILGQACGMVPVLGYFLFSKTAPFNLRLSCCKPDIRLMGKIMTLGIASFVMQVAATLVTVVFNQVVGVYGALDAIGVESALAAIGVAQKATLFAIMPLVGLIMGAQPIIGYNYGARLWQRVLDTLKWASVTGVIMGTVFFVLAHVIPDPVVALFGVTGDLEAFAVQSLQIYTIMYPLVGFQIVGSSYFQSSGQPFKAAVLELTRQVLFLIPLYLLLPPALTSALGGSSGLHGRGGQRACIADGLAALVTAAFVVRRGAQAARPARSLARRGASCRCGGRAGRCCRAAGVADAGRREGEGHGASSGRLHHARNGAYEPGDRAPVAPGGRRDGGLVRAGGAGEP